MTKLLIIAGIAVYVAAIIAVAWQKLKGETTWKR